MIFSLDNCIGKTEQLSQRSSLYSSNVILMFLLGLFMIPPEKGVICCKSVPGELPEALWEFPDIVERNCNSQKI